LAPFEHSTGCAKTSKSLAATHPVHDIGPLKKLTGEAVEALSDDPRIHRISDFQAIDHDW
jgi:hypothetical protein